MNLLYTVLTLISLLALISARVLTYWGNAGGAPCVFPFTYKHKTYESCIERENSGMPWCATTSNYDADKRWGMCKATGTIPTYGGNAGGKNCVFPYTYYGKQYESCMTYKSGGITWCATTSNYDADKQWGNCKAIGTVATYGGNTCGKNCVFPFTYRHKKYESCITLNNKGVPWCATTANYDADRQFGNCKANAGSSKKVIAGMYIAMHSDRTIERQTLASCEALCRAEKSFVCQSFDFEIAERSCMLSKMSYSEAKAKNLIMQSNDYILVAL